MALKRGGVRKKGNKKQKRSDFEFPYLEPTVSLITRKDEVEDLASYAGQLNREEKAWLNQFAKEYINADTNPGHAIFHITAAEKKICNDKNNARNRCIYTEEVAANRLNLVGNDWEMEKLLYGDQAPTEDLEPEEDIPEDEDY